MKKMILAALALGAFATANAGNQNQYSTTMHASDSTGISFSALVPNVLVLNPQAAQTVSHTLTQAEVQAAANTYVTMGNVPFTVWSNREYNCTYFVTTTTPGFLNYTDIAGDVHDNDDQYAMPIGNVQFKVADTVNLKGRNDGNNQTHNYTDLSMAYGVNNWNSLTTGNNTFIDEARPSDGGQFTLYYRLLNPYTYFIGGTYSATITVTATTE